MTDQQRWDSLGYSRPDEASSDTPNLDALARRGVIFDNAYSTSTACVPARTGLLTGLLHHRAPLVQGNARARTDSGLALREGYWTIAHAFQYGGYQTALFGKMHMQPLRARHGFEEMHTCEHLPAGYEAGTTDDYREWLTSKGLEDSRFVKPASPRVFPHGAEYHPTSWITRRATDFLQRANSSRPYFAVVSFPHPHTPYDPPEPYWSMYRPEDQQLPGNGVEVNRGYPWPFSAAVEVDEPRGFMTPRRVEHFPEGHVRQVLAAIRALTRHIDDQVGELLRYVDLEETLVFFLSDHGDYGGHRGYLGKIPWLPFDDLVKIPLFAVGQGVKGGRRVSGLVQNFDYVPTALEWAGIGYPASSLDARSVASVLTGAGTEAEREVFASTTEGWPMIRRGSYKQIWHPGADVDLLFNLEKDPGERQNLSGDPTYGDLLAQNKKKLAALLERGIPDLWLDD